MNEEKTDGLLKKVQNLIDICQKHKEPAYSRLDEIGAAIQAGANPEKFQKELDRLLGTEMAERDPDEEVRWEEDYRNRDVGVA